MKLFILVTVCMFSNRVECAMLDNMHTGSLQSALNQIMLSHGWSTKELSLNPGSSLVPPAEDTIEELQQLGEAEEDVIQIKNEKPTWIQLSQQRLWRTYSSPGSRSDLQGRRLRANKAELNQQ